MLISRRKTLQVLGLGAAGAIVNPFGPRLYFDNAEAQSGPGGRVWVNIYFDGGMDAAAFLHPTESSSAKAAEKAARKTLSKLDSELNVIHPEFGLHQQLRFIAAAYQQGNAAIYSKTGIPTGNSGSHEEARQDVVWGLVNGNQEFNKVGIMGRMMDLLYPTGSRPEFLAMDFSPGTSVLEGADTFKASNLSRVGFRDYYDSEHTQLAIYNIVRDDVVNDQQKRVKDAVAKLEATQKKIAEALASTTFNPAFPNTGFGQTMRQVFVAIRNFRQLGLRAISVSRGGFDTHNNQDPRVAANQAPQGIGANFQEFDRALEALWNNLVNAGLANEVCISLLTEFGRTVRENGSMGTDHGHGSASFVLGGLVAGGQVIGDPYFADDYSRPDNGFPVSIPTASIIKEIGKFMGCVPEALFPPTVLSQLPPMPPMFRV